MQDVHLRLKSYQEGQLCSRKVTVYETPDGWSWSHGAAKNLCRQVVVRHLTVPGRLNSSKSTTLSLKDHTKPRTTSEDKLSDLTPEMLDKSNVFISWTSTLTLPEEKLWRTSSSLLKRKLSKVQEEFLGYFGKMIPFTHTSYSSYKSSRLSESALTKLRQSDLANHFLPHISHEDSSRQSLEEVAVVKPYSFQKKLDNRKLGDIPYQPDVYMETRGSRWERRAEKVYLPSMGENFNAQTGKKVFVMFGLNQEVMRSTWKHTMQDPEAHYKTASKYNNCSGMSLRLLKSGGSDHYCSLNPTFYTSPNQVDHYSRRLMERLESLNPESVTSRWLNLRNTQ